MLLLDFQSEGSWLYKKRMYESVWRWPDLRIRTQVILLDHDPAFKIKSDPDSVWPPRYGSKSSFSIMVGWIKKMIIFPIFRLCLTNFIEVYDCIFIKSDSGSGFYSRIGSGSIRTRIHISGGGILELFHARRHFPEFFQWLTYILHKLNLSSE